ncbi:MAG: hypothetical protein ACRBFS_08055 [Aureispira sp.]
MKDTTKKILLVIALVIVLAIGGFILWKTMKGFSKTKGQGSTKESTGTDKEKPPVGGRQDPRDLFSDDELKRDTLANKGIVPEYEPVLAHSPEGRRLIEEKMKDIQTGAPAGLEKIRGTEQIGMELLSIPNFSSSANAAIRKMFGYMDAPVDPDNVYTWPIYGKYEASGAALRRDLEKFLAIPTHKLHLGPGREENAGWLSSIGLNIMMLTNINRLPTLTTIRGNWAKGKDRDGLINYLRINRFTGTHEKYLAKMEHGKSPYKAYGNRNLAKVLLATMDRLDAVCYRYAKEALIGDGRLIEQTLASSMPKGASGKMNRSTKSGAKKV